MEIRKYPDPVLDNKCEPVNIEEIDEGFKKTLREMFETMYKAKGIGLAAPQVGISKTFFVMNLTGKPEDEVVCINPLFSAKYDNVNEEEGCLSLPGLLGKVTRAKKVEMEYTDAAGTAHKETFEELGARAVQHEKDHLDGVLFITRLTPAGKSALKPKLNEMEREFESTE